MKTIFMQKKEYQSGCRVFSEVEKGWFSNWLVERSKQGWTLKTVERYFSKEHDQDCLFWVLERDV